MSNATQAESSILASSEGIRLIEKIDRIKIQAALQVVLGSRAELVRS